ncbi:hypothetical protein ABZ896_03375 [Streptomyces sp. NPDC047072]|uniref:hypothetical protein n=1 Tax=Streptomyces sp. NPDC047072 TaxID=3154809 RepID=UPI00340C5895
MRFFAGPRLLIIVLGYLALPEDGASALFQVINQRYLTSASGKPGLRHVMHGLAPVGLVLELRPGVARF